MTACSASDPSLPFQPGFKTSQEELKADPELLGVLLDYHVVPDRTLNESQVGSGVGTESRHALCHATRDGPSCAAR